MRIDDENYVTVRERQRNALEKQLDKVLKQYSNAKICWAQEEHKNQGAYPWIKERLETVIFNF